MLEPLRCTHFANVLYCTSHSGSGFENVCQCLSLYVCVCLCPQQNEEQKKLAAAKKRERKKRQKEKKKAKLAKGTSRTESTACYIHSPRV